MVQLTDCVEVVSDQGEDRVEVRVQEMEVDWSRRRWNESSRV